jgi:hypothetical protein
MYCKNCGKQIDDDSKFCNYCGTEQSINSKRESNTENSKVDLNLNNHETHIHFPKTQSKIDQPKQGRYDESYEKETGATVVGFIVLITNFLIVLVKPEVNELLYIAGGIISFVLRIIFTVWIVNIAKRQNRPANQWGFSGFIFPSFTLIIIGMSKKLNKDLENDKIKYATNANKQEYIDDNDKKTFVVQTLNPEMKKNQKKEVPTQKFFDNDNIKKESSEAVQKAKEVYANKVQFKYWDLLSELNILRSENGGFTKEEEVDKIIQLQEKEDEWINDNKICKYCKAIDSIEKGKCIGCGEEI